MKIVSLATVTNLAAGTATDGVQVTSYGKGQCSGATYTVAAHGKIDVEFTIQMQCMTGDDVRALDSLVRSLLDASKYQKYDDLKTTEASGGISFFEFLCGGAKASYKDTQHTMNGWGLSPKAQMQIVQQFMQSANKMNTFKYAGSIDNTKYDYDVTGNLFAIVMDATVQQGDNTQQSRLLAPNPMLVSNDGSAAALPTSAPLY